MITDRPLLDIADDQYHPAMLAVLIRFNASPNPSGYAETSGLRFYPGWEAFLIRRNTDEHSTTIHFPQHVLDWLSRWNALAGGDYDTLPVLSFDLPELEEFYEMPTIAMQPVEMRVVINSVTLPGVTPILVDPNPLVLTAGVQGSIRVRLSNGTDQAGTLALSIASSVPLPVLGLDANTATFTAGSTVDVVVTLQAPQAAQDGDEYVLTLTGNEIVPTPE